MAVMPENYGEERDVDMREPVLSGETTSLSLESMQSHKEYAVVDESCFTEQIPNKVY